MKSEIRITMTKQRLINLRNLIDGWVKDTDNDLEQYTLVIKQADYESSGFELWRKCAGLKEEEVEG